MRKILSMGAACTAALAKLSGAAAAQDRWDWDGGRAGDREFG